MNTTNAARTLGKIGGSSRTPAKAEAARKNGSLGGRYGLIYEPKGRAKEYANLACNVYSGCSHGCLYCYAPNATHKTRDVFSNPSARENFLMKLRNDASKWKGPKHQVLLSFTCDPFQPIEDEYHITLNTIHILHEFGFNVCTLTKGGSRALKSMPMFRIGDSFATTLTFLDNSDSLKWEPEAALPEDRINTIRKFHDKGIETWVSLEPTIDPVQSLAIIDKTHEFVDLYKVGKLNHHPLGKTIDWADYTAKAVHKLSELEKPYIVKDDLAQCVPPGFSQITAVNPV